MASLESILSQNIPFTNITVINVVFALIIVVVGYIISKIIFNAFVKGLKKTKLPDTKRLNVITFKLAVLQR